jgi:hypothetical protein
MPQFDFYSFPLQNFFLILAFYFVYFFIVFFYLPNFSEVLKMRKKLFSYYVLNNVNAQPLSLLGSFQKHIFSK